MCSDLSRVAATLALIGCVAATAAGCTATVVSGGPLSGGSEQGTECGPVPHGGVLSYGGTALEYSGTGPADVTSVTLASPHDLRLLAAWVLPVTGEASLYGVRAGWPPAPGLPAGTGWAQRQPADGARIPGPASTRTVSLLLVVKPSGTVGTAAGILVSYRAGGQDYQFQTQIQLVVENGGNCPF